MKTKPALMNEEMSFIRYKVSEEKQTAVWAFIFWLKSFFGEEDFYSGLFLAEYEHLFRYGRPILGDTWLFYPKVPVSRSFMGKFSGGQSFIPPEMTGDKADYWLSGTDKECMKEAFLCEFPERKLRYSVLSQKLLKKGCAYGAPFCLSWLIEDQDKFEYIRECSAGMAL